MHNIVRYALVFAHGPTVLFDLATSRHLSAALESVSDVRASIPFDYMLVGVNAETMARRWALQIHEALGEQGCAADRLAVDRADTLMIQALEELGTRVVDGKQVLEHARAIKSAEEIRAFRASLATCEESVRSLHTFAVPGVTEAEAFGHLVGQSLARGGEYPETRLLTGGPRTEPLVSGDIRSGLAGGRAPRLRHRPHRTNGLLQRHFPAVGLSATGDQPRRRQPCSTSPGSRLPTTSTCSALARRSSNFRPGRFDFPTPISLTVTPIWCTAAVWGWNTRSCCIRRTRMDGMYDGRFEANMIVCVECCSASPFDPRNRSESTCYHADPRLIRVLNNSPTV